MLHYCCSRTIGYIRILELDGVKKPNLKAALDTIAADFDHLDGFIIDIRNCPGGEDSIAITIINRFCDRKRIAFHRRTKIGPGERDYTRLKTWYLEPQGRTQFTRPIALLTCDSVFSGGEAFALAIRELPHVTIIGDHTNGIFSYQLEKELPNGWEYRLSYQTYFSADMVCYEGNGVPVDIKMLNRKADIESGVDPLITRALKCCACLTDCRAIRYPATALVDAPNSAPSGPSWQLLGLSGGSHDHSPTPDITYHRPPVSEVGEVSYRSIVFQATYISDLMAASRGAGGGGSGGVCIGKQ